MGRCRERELTLRTTLEWVHGLREQPLQLRDQQFLRVRPPIVLARSDGASPVAKVSLFSLGGGERKK